MKAVEGKTNADRRKAAPLLKKVCDLKSTSTVAEALGVDEELVGQLICGAEPDLRLAAGIWQQYGIPMHYWVESA